MECTVLGNATVDRTFDLGKLAQGQSVTFQIDESTDWVEELLVKLSELGTGDAPGYYVKSSSLLANLTIKRSQTSVLGDCILILGEVGARYLTSSVRTLKPSREDVSVKINICFMLEAFAELNQYIDEVNVFCDGEVRDLYFYKGSALPLDQVITEQVLLSANRFPRRLDD